MINNLNSGRFSPELPWNETDPRKLGPCVVNFVAEHEPYFRRWAETWYENVQFLYGNHSFKWSQRHGFAVDYDFLRTTPNSFELRAQTNLAKVVVESIASFMFNNLPDWEVSAMDNTSIKGKRYEKIVQKLLDAYMERLCMDKEFRVSSVSLATFGQIGGEIGWNPLSGQMMNVPRYQKVISPVYTNIMRPDVITSGLIETPIQAMNADGSPMTEEKWETMVDQKGQQIFDRIFTGDVGFDLLTPFEYAREIGTYAGHKSKYWQRFKLMDYDEFIDKYKHVEGQTINFNMVRPTKSSSLVYDMATRFYMRLQFVTPPSANPSSNNFKSSLRSSLFRNKVFVIEHYDRPHPEKWPNGRRLIIANGLCTHITEPNYRTNKADGWHPFAEAQWLVTAPSSIALSPTTETIKKNRELDMKDSLIATALRRNMGSQLLIGNSSGLDPQQITGEPGKYHEVNDIHNVRWLHDDMPIPPVIAALRQMDKDDVYETTGAQDAIRGSSESTATSGYQEKIREEREEKRLSPGKQAFNSFVETIGEKVIACLKANVVKLDDWVIGFMTRSAAGEFTVQDVLTFLSSNIDYGIDVKIDRSSMTIKSRATHQATLIELVTSVPAVAHRVESDAKVLDKFLKEFDAEEIRDQSSAHRDRVHKENEVFLDMLRLGINAPGLLKPIVIREDDDDIHMAEHDEFLIKHFDEFRSNEELHRLFLLHKEEHRKSRDEKLGRIGIGAAQLTPISMNIAMGMPPPQPEQVYQDTLVRRQMEARALGATPPQGEEKENQKGKDGERVKNKNPQAPRLISGSEGGGDTIDPAAPSENTPSHVSSGGF